MVCLHLPFPKICRLCLATIWAVPPVHGGEYKGGRRQGEVHCRQGAGEPLLEENRLFLRVGHSPPTHMFYLTMFFHLHPADQLIK